VCKQVSGKTALEWINEYVLIDVRHWLKNSDKSVKEIADLLNFPNLSFFGKYCRAHLGMSPLKYRRELRGKGSGEE
jgi:AraC-like DNA-binding protein